MNVEELETILKPSLRSLNEICEYYNFRRKEIKKRKKSVSIKASNTMILKSEKELQLKGLLLFEKSIFPNLS